MRTSGQPAQPPDAGETPDTSAIAGPTTGPTASPALAAASSFGIGRVVAVFVLLFGVTALAVRCVSVASQAPHGAGAADHYAHPAAGGPPLTLEELGAKAGCRPTVQNKAADLRQGYCDTASGRFFMTTFSSGESQQAWLEQAQDYGPVLLGNRWAVGAGRQLLEQLRGKLGGEIYAGSHAHG